MQEDVVCMTVHNSPKGLHFCALILLITHCDKCHCSKDNCTEILDSYRFQNRKISVTTMNFLAKRKQQIFTFEVTPDRLQLLSESYYGRNSLHVIVWG